MSIFLTEKDLMRLLDIQDDKNAAKAHRLLIDKIAPHKSKLTIKEYCEYEHLDFDEVWEFLREGDNLRFQNTVTYLTAKDLLLIYPQISLSTAKRKIRTIKDCLQIPNYQKITISQFCRTEGLDEREVRKVLAF